MSLDSRTGPRVGSPIVPLRHHQRRRLHGVGQGQRSEPEARPRLEPPAVANPGAAPSHVRHRTRDALATHFLEPDYDIRTVQGLLGHQDVKTTMIYTHVLNRGPGGGRSPVDSL